MDNLVDLYKSGLSIPELSQKTGVPLSTIRFRLKKLGVLRTRSEALALAAKAGKLGGGLRGKTRVFTDEHKLNIKASRVKWGMENAAGFSIKPNGYAEHTTGIHKGRLVHVVIMEKRIGRRLLGDECVHHIDGDRLNNDDNNLALVTKSGHARLHRREDGLSGKIRERNKNGRFGL